MRRAEFRAALGQPPYSSFPALRKTAFMKLREAYGVGKFGLSFELFPPKTAAGDDELASHLDELVAFRPSYITCTYGAADRRGPRRSKWSTGPPAAPIAGRVASDVRWLNGRRVAQLPGRSDAGAVDYIVALRGDPPRGETAFRPVAGGLRYAAELVELVRREFGQFGIAVAGYPETHREAASPAADLENLRRKVDCGAEIVITQLFYDNADFFRFRERCEQLGIRVPIVPGILPVTSLAQISADRLAVRRPLARAVRRTVRAPRR